MLTAATVKDTTLRNQLIDMVFKRASDNSTGGVLPTGYHVSKGTRTGGIGR
jgi:hypothetical protein